MSEQMQTIDNPETSIKPPNPKLQNWKIVFKKVRKSKGAMAGLFLILFL
ncbi:hypothetical protein GCM10027286_09230 [Virgibacillus ainsalahensis]